MEFETIYNVIWKFVFSLYQNQELPECFIDYIFFPSKKISR